MERKNYFEMLGLDFDPPERNERKMQLALDNWKKRMEDMLANETIATRRTAISDELSQYNAISDLLKDTKLRNQEARALKEQRIQQLEKLIDILLMGQSGTMEVTGAQIRNVSLKLKLSIKTVEEIYKKKGFEIQKRNATISLNEAFLSTVIFNNICDKLDQLRKMTIPQYPWTSNVTDLYDLACFLSGGGEDDRTSFHRKRTAELHGIMDSWSARLASDMSAQGHLLADLFTAGTSQVFDSEANRKKYDQSLERNKLKEFFALLKSAPEDFKRDRYFADTCIGTIQKSFPDYNLALALYNQEAGIAQDPYEPIEALIHVSCGVCHTPAQFRTHEEAEKARCAACGASLYTQCPKCGRKVPTSADRCLCNFQLSEMQFFEDYLKAAQFALKEMDLSEARRQLSLAENAYPGHPKLASLQKQVKEESDRYQKPLDELQALIAGNLFSQAQKKLHLIASTMPQLRLDTQRKLIQEKLEEAKRRMPLPSISPADAANRCMEVLRIVKDYQPALDRLRSYPPRTPQNLQAATQNTSKLICILSWTAAGDSGVTYQVVRKKNGIPSQYSDGEILAKDLNALEYRDESIQPGVSYGYGVFACRYGVYSPAATCEVVNYSELDENKLEAVSENGRCCFRWSLPTNCQGVRILRAQNAIPGEAPGRDATVVVSGASTNFEDCNVQNNVRYGYRLQCIYPYQNGFRFSHGITTMLMPEAAPVAVQNVTIQMRGKTATVSWKNVENVRRMILIREVKNSVSRDQIGKLFLMSDLLSVLGRGKAFASATNTDGSCQFELPPHTSCNLAIVSASSSKGVISDIIRVSSVEKCEINRSETRIENNMLKIVLQKLPMYLEAIHYIAAVKTGPSIPWAAQEDAKERNLLMISRSNYEKDGMIVVNRLPEENLYISVIGQYKMPNGTVVYSEPSRIKLSNKPKEKISYHLEWASAGFFSSRKKPKNCKLIVQSDAPEIPQMKLVYRSDGHIPMKLQDSKTVVLHLIPESENGLPNGKYIYSFPDSTWESIDPKTEIRLMISDNDRAEYEVVCSDLSSLKVPQS
ncbi:hypothetical protein [Solibaculum mannosilyticum]|uniref:hypothetical protein n=1 Tax=Solibaculum mannosilyticum TaxID=2780922 RepID=UPI0034AD571D